MNALDFWNVIGVYNENTIIIQLVIILLLITSYFISIKTRYSNNIKYCLGIVNLYVAFVFFGYYGTEPIQKYFAFPLYILIGLLFIYEAFKNKKDRLTKTTLVSLIFFILFLLYPLVSWVIGNKYPKMVLYIMPCPIVTLSIVIYSMYNIKNKLLLICLSIWGLTGIKSIFFNAYEDLILLVAGLYCVYVLIKTLRIHKK